LNDALVLEWVAATDLWTGRPSWLPRELCELDFCVDERYFVPRFRTSTNGLASGNTVAEAVLHGLCEVIERDSLWRDEQMPLAERRRIAQETISPRLARRVLDRFVRAGIETQITDLSGPTGLPCFQVWIDHPDGPTAARGEGCHPSRLVALLRALTEAAQSRLTYIAGNRDDIDRRIYRGAGDRAAAARQRGVARGDFGAAPTLPRAGFREYVREVVGRVRAVTGMSPLAVDLRMPDFELPVVTVVAPGLDIPRTL
jgi:ribosomal protein S12 methylthiotransferase accessory factor